MFSTLLALPAAFAWMGIDPATTSTSETVTTIRWRGADPTDPKKFDLHIGVADKPYFIYGYLAKDVDTFQSNITLKLPSLPHLDNYVFRAVEPGTTWVFAESDPFELWPE